MAIKVDLVQPSDGNFHRKESVINAVNLQDDFNINDNIEQSSEIDSFIKNGTWVTPMEYYSSLDNVNSTNDNTKQGFLKDIPTSVNNSAKNTTYFWVEDLKNWCRYIYNGNSQAGTNIFNLFVWNGRDDWIPITNFSISNDPGALVYDKYHIAKMQDKLLKHFYNTDTGDNSLSIISERGIQQVPYVVDNEQVENPMLNPDLFHGYARLFWQPGWPNRQLYVHAIKLQKTIKYTINSSDDFQTIRWQTIPSIFINSPNVVQFAQSNFCIRIPTGAPPVWRLPTGEILLCLSLGFFGDNGNAYHYISENGKDFRKVYDVDIDGTGIAQTNEMLGSDNIEASNWINSICANFFGSGMDKTIEKDWLREYYITPSNTIAIASYDNMLDSTLRFEQHNINKENSLKCTFRINRPVVTTDTKEISDYAKKW